jgi:formiminotetrahydrofolate cyclodeaminase
MDADSAAFDAVVTAKKLSQGTDSEKSARQAAIQAATLHAAEVPLDVARAGLQVLELAQVVAQSGSTSSVTDAAVAAWMARAAVESAGLNVRVNAAALTDQNEARVLLEELRGLRQRAVKLADQILAAADQRARLQ